MLAFVTSAWSIRNSSIVAIDPATHLLLPSKDMLIEVILKVFIRYIDPKLFQ